MTFMPFARRDYDITDCDLDGDREPIHWCATCGEYEVSAEGQECSECLGALEADDGDRALDAERDDELTRGIV